MEQAERIAAAVTGAVADGQVPGAAWWVDRDGALVACGAAGVHTPGGGDPVAPDTVFRIASITKPVVAAAAMSLVDDGILRLDDPVDARCSPSSPTGRSSPTRRTPPPARCPPPGRSPCGTC
ncbi:beta-lactamase family protein [Blastococcus sp. TML/M2B]|uniref:serine hydrolase domain-containing protein n=1 Tax=unclassified Blastococcus TaxID=2619396 RepID=UPI00190C2DAC|nr:MULTISPECIES: serine hydrolase domain-containing protein [unclassified Blastococcus]MBN1093917.1 beta-lactamase family protein [Blastococcus sp. TML/M2B]MBN1095964.1 beta-lactamase family protein [Blastococcus sp. TML/C7B]